MPGRQVVMRIEQDDERRGHHAGDAVPTSGIYTAIHQSHRPDHEVVAIQGEEFPPCRICKDQVRFYIAWAVPHMTHDFDLTGPDRRVLVRRAKKKGAGGC